MPAEKRVHYRTSSPYLHEQGRFCSYPQNVVSVNQAPAEAFEQWADSGCQNRQADPFEGLIMLARFGFSVPDARIALEKGHAWP